jgi:uncharacterized protein
VNEVFLDSVFAIALEMARDQNHAAAFEQWQQFVDSGRSFVTTSFVVDEAATYLNARGRHDRAVRLGRRLMSDARSIFVEVDRTLFLAGWNYFVDHADKQYSLTDCISFVLMDQRAIRQALTFDHHFRQAGFDCLPE